jgi:hypothetical protein
MSDSWEKWGPKDRLKDKGSRLKAEAPRPLFDRVSFVLVPRSFVLPKGVGEARKGHFGSVGAEWRTEFARKNRTKSYIQSIATTHHAEVRKLHPCE